MASAAGVPSYALPIVAVLIIGSFIPKTPEASFKDDISPDVTAIKKYAVTHKNALLRSVYNNLDIANDITLQPNVKNKMPLPKLSVSGQPGPRTGVHDSEGSGFGYSDRELEVFDFQRDITIDPSLYRNTYLARFRPAGEGTKNMVIPFAQFTMETFLKDNTAWLNNTTAFNGVGKGAFTEYVPANTYAVGAFVKVTNGSKVGYYKAKATVAANESPAVAAAKWEDVRSLAIAIGLGTTIKTERTAGKILAASTGSITREDAFEQALMVYRKLKEEARNQFKDINLYASSDIMDMIKDSYKDDIKKYTDADGNIIFLPRTDNNCKLTKASWMRGSSMMVAGPKSNFYMGTDLLSDMNELKLIEDVYTLRGGLTGLIGFQIADLDHVVTNDQN